jgi:hypothetical protein
VEQPEAKERCKNFKAWIRTGQLDGQRFGVVDYPAFLIPA